MANIKCNDYHQPGTVFAESFWPEPGVSVRPLPECFDALDLAERCCQLVGNLMDPEERCDASLSLLTLEEALEYLMPALNTSLTAQHLKELEATPPPAFPSGMPRLNEESDILVGYSQSLVRLLAGRARTGIDEEQLAGLLYDLLHYLNADLRLPRLQ